MRMRSLIEMVWERRSIEQANSSRTRAEIKWGTHHQTNRRCEAPGCDLDDDGGAKRLHVRNATGYCREHWIYSTKPADGQLTLISAGGVSMAVMAKAGPAQKKADPETMAYAIRREGSNFRLVKYLIQGERVLAQDESDLDSRMAQIGRIEIELRRVE